MSAALLAGALAGYGVAIPVGAIAVLVIGLSARTRLLVGVAAALGVATADGLYACVAVLGGAALAPVIEPAAGPLRWSAAVVLVVLAVRTGLGALRQYRDPAHPPTRTQVGLGTPARAFAGLLGLTLLNPMTIVYFGALVLGLRAGGGPQPATGGAGAVLFVLGAFAASASWQVTLAGGGSLVGRACAGPRGRLATALGSSAVVIALAVRLLIAG